MDCSALKRAYSVADSVQQAGSEDFDTRPSKAKRGDTQAASQRHIKTEQARRDKISAGFQVLQGLMPGREKVEKAMLLTQAAEYISQLQGVLQMLMSSGAVSKLPDDLQFQIRTLLPRRDGKPLATAVAPPGGFEPSAPAPAPQQGAASSLPAAQLPLVSIVAPAALQMPDIVKELPAEETALMNHIQGLLQQQQQQAVAAQQLQAWQQTIQALQMQALQQQQQGHCVPDAIAGMGGYPAASNAFAGLPFLPAPHQGPVGTTVPVASATPTQAGLASRRPTDCYADELPKCGLQQLMDAAACEPNGSSKLPAAAPHKARKSAVKVRRHTTAARIPKPEAPNPSRVGAGRPEPV